MAGVNAFREAYLSAGTTNPDDFTDFGARGVRYAVLWAMFENTAYRDIHTWATKLRKDYGLYKYVRGVYNPAFRLASFWQAHLMGGTIDPNAGDGQATPSCLPILIPDANKKGEALRAALAALWRESNWQVRKDVLSLWGTIYGDVALRPVDDVDRRKVYLEVVTPRILKDVTLDPFGNVKGYVLEEMRDDPRTPNATNPRQVTYREEVTRDAENRDNVIFRTFLDNAPYAWNGVAAEWAEPYGFVPFVVIQHNNVGLSWGLSEMMADLPKFHEVNDLASKANDQIRKLVDAPWLLAGVQKPTTTPTTTNTAATTDKPQPGREEVPMLYGPPGATATPLVAPLDLAATLDHIKELLGEIERDYPELKADELRLSGTLTGRALELAQQPAADKVLQRRPNYDDGLVRAQQMAIAIGGFRRYRGYEGFDLESYAAGQLAHAIGSRPVFQKTFGDLLEEQQLLWTTVAAAVTAGNTLDAPTAGALLELVLRKNGFTDEDLKQIGTMRAAGILNAQEDIIPPEGMEQ